MCIVETKKVTSKDSRELFSKLDPKGETKPVTCSGKLRDAMVITFDGKLIMLSTCVYFELYCSSQLCYTTQTHLLWNMNQLVNFFKDIKQKINNKTKWFV